MNEADARAAMVKFAGPQRKALANGHVRRVKQNHKPRNTHKEHLAKHGLKGS